MIRIFFLFLLGNLFLPLTFAGEIFLYKAPDGVMHFSDIRHHAGYKRISAGSGGVRDYTYGRNTGMSMSEIEDVISRISVMNRVDPDLVMAVIKAESDFDARAVSGMGARGLMQLMPATAARYKVHDLFDPVENIRGGVLYLRELFTLYDGNMDYSLAAYNAGESAVFKYRGVPPFRETQNYVKKVKRYYRQMKRRN